MCYCIYDNEGICELLGFVEGKTKDGDCSYTYHDSEEIQCPSRVAGWYLDDDDDDDDYDPWDDDDWDDED